MDLLKLDVLGPFRMVRHGQPLTDVATDKARALLTYLALAGTQPRTTLAALLWPYLSQEAAFDNLRKTLYRLRQGLDAAAPGSAGLLVANRQTAGLDLQRVAVDVLHFQNLLAECELHPHADMHTCEACLAHVADAVELYRGDLLAGFGLADAPEFEEWLLLRRQTLHQQTLLALATLATAWEERGDLQRALAYASRALLFDPYREESHRQQMRLLARLGLPHQALQQYEACRRLLRAELASEPEAATVALYEQIRTGAFPEKQTRSQGNEEQFNPPALRALADEWGDVPETGRVYGRQPELAQVTGWLAGADGVERCQLVALLGIGGLGKTTLAAAAAKGAAGVFERVIWRSLLNAPPPDELLPMLLQQLSSQTLSVPPAGLDGQLALLLDYLRQERCLLVLDNFESVLQADGTGQMRAGYEAYAQLLRQVAANKHRSCVVLTSREWPQGMKGWEADWPWVRSMRLEGLDVTAGQHLLSARGLMGEAVEVAKLVQRYSGHPLALKLVAETVQALFGGAIDDFLQEAAPIFDDIRHMLDGQFARLSPLEQEILCWLAIEREAVSAPVLRENLMQPVAAGRLLEALRSLQRRSLLESTAGGFTLQNVVMEYVTERLIEQVCQELVAEKCDLLMRHALIKANAKEHVRQTQERLLLRPVARFLAARLDEAAVHALVRRLLAALRTQQQKTGYAAGNLLNVLLTLGYDVQRYDFSQLAIWQAYLRGHALAGVTFAHSDLRSSVFTDAFHNAHVIAFSPAGERLVVGMGDGTIRVWSRGGEPLDVWTGNGKAVWLLAFSPASAPGPPLLATDGAHWSINLWDVAQRRVVQSLTGHTTVVHDLAFSPDGRHLAACAEDGTVRVWEVASGRSVHVLFGHSAGVECVAFSPNGHWLASGGQDKIVCVWDVQTGTVATTLRGHTNTVRKVAFCPSPQDMLLRVVTASWDKTLRVWNGATGETLHVLRGHTGEISSLALSADGTLAISAGDEPTVWAWDVHTGTVRLTLHGHAGWVASAALSPDGRQVATVGFDQTIRLWDLHDAGPAWADGHASLRLQGHHRPAGLLHFVRAASGDLSLTLVNYDLAVYTWALATQTLIHTQVGPPTKHDDFAPLALALDGVQMACRNHGYGIQLWSARTGQAQLVLPGHTNTVTALQFSPDGQLLASGSWDTTVRVWQVSPGPEYGRLRATLQAHTTKVTAVAFSPDGTLLASAGRDNVVHLWDVATAHRLATVSGLSKAVLCLAFAPSATPALDGAMAAPRAVLAGGGIDRVVRIWRVYDDETGVKVSEPLVCARPDQTDSIAAVVFSPNGRWVASASWDKTVSVWDAQRGVLVRDLCGHTESVKFLAFSPDNAWLASSSHDETVRVWGVETGACVATLRPPGPYAGMNITGVTGIAEAQKAALVALGAVEEAAQALG